MFFLLLRYGLLDNKLSEIGGLGLTFLLRHRSCP